MKGDNIKLGLAIAAFVSSISFGVAGMVIPPPGEIHNSVLIFIAQMLLFTSTLLGLSLNLGRFGSTEKKKEEAK